MEISKENVFKTQYTSVLGRSAKRKRTSKILNFIKKNKIISITILIFIVCSSFNMLLVYNFIKILENM